MQQVATLGIDAAKNVFHLHGVDAHGQVVLKKRLVRTKVLAFVAGLPPCLIGPEASGSAHSWAQEFTKLGHTVQLISPQFVKPSIQGNKNDPQDAEGICKAVGRPHRGCVPITSVDQQDRQALHRIRERQIKGRTALAHQMRGLLAEYGVVMPQGVAQARHQLPFILEEADHGLTRLAREWVQALAAALQAVAQRLQETKTQMQRVFASHDACQRLAQLAGVGPLTATAFVAAVGEARPFKNGRECAAWLGLVPRQTSTEGEGTAGHVDSRTSLPRSCAGHGVLRARQVRPVLPDPGYRRDRPRSANC